jgi:hypothetical protein
VKLKYLPILLFSLLLLSCSSNPDAGQVEYPDDDDIATIVAQTLTQQAIAQPESTVQAGNTSQPSQQDPTQQPAAEDDGTSDEASSDEAPADGNTGDEGAADDGTSGDTDEEAPNGGATETPGPLEDNVLNQGVPGLDVLDLMERLSGFGFDCTQPEDQDGIHVRECNYETSEYQFMVTIWGSTPDAVDLIEAAAFYFGDLDYAGLTSVVFELVAETPYEGATPEDAGAWVEESMPDIQGVGDEAVSIFGDVRFYLYAFPSAHVLEIGNLQ